MPDKGSIDSAGCDGTVIIKMEQLFTVQLILYIYKYWKYMFD